MLRMRSSLVAIAANKILFLISNEDKNSTKDKSDFMKLHSLQTTIVRPYIFRIFSLPAPLVKRR